MRKTAKREVKKFSIKRHGIQLNTVKPKRMEEKNGVLRKFILNLTSPSKKVFLPTP